MAQPLLTKSTTNLSIFFFYKNKQTPRQSWNRIQLTTRILENLMLEAQESPCWKPINDFSLFLPSTLKHSFSDIKLIL